MLDGLARGDFYILCPDNRMRRSGFVTACCRMNRATRALCVSLA